MGDWDAADEADAEEARKYIAELEEQVGALTEWNQNAQSLNGLLELRVERLEKAHRENIADYQERAAMWPGIVAGAMCDRSMAALEGRQE